MEIIEVDQEKFNSIIPSPLFVFGTSSFAYLNRDKTDKVYYLLFKDSKYRLGLIAEIKDNCFYSPFSAPFGGFIYINNNNNNIKISQIDSVIELLLNWARNKELNTIKITLPPSIYNDSFISKQVNSLYRFGFNIDKIDLNYSFATRMFSGDYKENIWRNARKNLNNALKNKFTFHRCQDIEEKKVAYQVIKLNREERGFPIRMSWSQIKKTIELISADFFICFNSDLSPVASAIVFHTADKIVQIIYWGDIPEYAHLKTMNFLSYKVFEYYNEKNIKIIDIGPSTEDSIPNHGLCEFKESIGCNISQKLTFFMQIK